MHHQSTRRQVGVSGFHTIEAPEGLLTLLNTGLQEEMAEGVLFELSTTFEIDQLMCMPSLG